MPLRVLLAALVALLLGVGITLNPAKWVAAAAVVVRGSAFFCCLSITLADQPMNCVALGTGKALEYEKQLRHVIDYDS